MITITFKGKQYDDLGTAVLKAAEDQLKNHIEMKIEPFREEVKKQGGTVIIEMNYNDSKNTYADVRASDISDELKQRITAALHQDS